MSPSIIHPVQLGIITDIQFANKPDVILEDTRDVDDPLDASPSSNSKHVLRVRRYDRVLSKCASTASKLNANKVTATLQLGDIIDGNDTLQSTREELQAVMEKLQALNMPVLNVVGNHCLDAGREHVIQTLGLSKTYYSRDLSSEWRLIILDTVDVNINRETGHPHQELAVKYLETHKGEPNAVSWGGGIGSEQLRWLKNLLVETRQQRMKAVVCGHIPVFLPEEIANKSPHLLWNSDMIVSILEEFADVVKAYFAGHFHEGAYTKNNGIHYVVFESMLDSQCSEGAWGIVRFHDHAIIVDGYGDMTSRHLDI